ncbi:MAG: PstS family phosphate ABC transporter substrate-binding protein [Spirulinaceae cyanobacterium]
MSQKNETLPLVLALVVTAALLGGGGWWLLRQFGDSSANDSSATDSNSNRVTQSSQVANFAQLEGVPNGLFNYGGSTTWAPIRKEVDSAIQTVWPEFNLRYTDHPTKAPGSSTGIEMLLKGQLAFSQSSRSLKDEEYEQAAQRGFTIEEIPVAIDGIAIAANPDLDVSGLSIKQIRDIYTGKITNWNEIGGPNLPITPYSRRLEDGGTVEFFVDNILAEEEFGDNVKFIPTTTEAIRAVAVEPGGLYYASAPEIVPQCTIKSLPLASSSSQEFVSPYQEPFVPLSQCPNQRNELNSKAFQTGTYPITRRLFVIVKKNGQDDEQAGVAYANLLLSDQGQKLVREAGFVNIR